MPREFEHPHTVEAIRERLARHKPSYVRDWIYGGIDGTVTTFAVVSGVLGAELSARIVLIMRFANLFADGFSMAASNFLGTRAEQDDYRRLEQVERRHIELYPEGEREEIRQIYREKGFAGAELEKTVELVTADRRRWVKTMLADEYGLPSEIRSPLKAAASIFAAFFACGLVPLVPYLLDIPRAFEFSATATGVIFFLIGSIRSRWSTASRHRSGFETFVIGSLAALLADAVGRLLKGIGG